MFRRSLLSLATILVLPCALIADPLPFLPEDMLTRDSFSGDWHGARPRLEEAHGVALSVTYIGEVWGNLSGGLQTGSVYDGLLEMAVEVDLEKLTRGSWKGATFYVSSLLPHGRSISANYAGDIFGVSNIDAPHEISLYELWFEQNYEPFSVRLGQLTADSEFAISDVGSLFLNSTFGWPTGISVNANAPAYPTAGLGARLRLELTENASFAAGFYDGDPSDLNAAGNPTNLHGTQWNLSKQQGMFAIFEFAYAHHQAKVDQHHCHIPPGFVKVGTWLHTGQFADNKSAKTHASNFGIYAIADQKLIVEEDGDDQGLSAFGRFFYSPANRSFIDYYCDCGLVYSGLLPMRDQDHLGLAFGYGNISGDLAETQRRVGDPVQSDTAVLEVSYLAQLTPYFSVQPDLQFIMQPDGASRSDGGIPDAVVAGMRFQIDF